MKKKQKCYICSLKEATYICKDCNTYYCENCANIDMFTCECLLYENIIKIEDKEDK